MLNRIVAFSVTFFLMATLFSAPSSHAQSQEQSGELDALNRGVAELFGLGKRAEAIPLAKKSVELTAAKWGEEHTETADRMHELARLLESTGQYGGAELYYKRTLA